MSGGCIEEPFLSEFPNNPEIPMTLINPTRVIIWALAIAAAGFGAPDLAPYDSLGRLALLHGKYFGSLYDDCCIRPSELPPQQAALRASCTMITDAHFFMKSCHPQRDTFDFEAGDRVTNWAEANNMLMRGHTLVWHAYVPDWLSAKQLSLVEKIFLLKKHIAIVVGRYRGRMYAWDVINEPFEHDGSLRKSFYYMSISRDYIAQALLWAHAADPAAKLFINEYSTEEINRKSNSLYALAKDLISRGVPLHGIGFQMHLSLENRINFTSVRENLKRFADLGLEIHLTEVDVKIKDPASPADLAAQAAVYSEITRLFLSEKRYTAMIMWGLSDKTSWIPHYFKGYGSACILDTNYRPKPAFKTIAQEMKN